MVLPCLHLLIVATLCDQYLAIHLALQTIRKKKDSARICALLMCFPHLENLWKLTFPVYFLHTFQIKVSRQVCHPYLQFISFIRKGCVPDLAIISTKSWLKNQIQSALCQLLSVLPCLLVRFVRIAEKRYAAKNRIMAIFHSMFSSEKEK